MTDPVAEAALDATFAALARPITYRPSLDDAGVLVYAHRLRPAQILDGLGGGRQYHDGLIVQIRAADLPAGAPADGDLIVIDGARYRVRSSKWADSGRLVQEIEAVPEC